MWFGGDFVGVGWVGGVVDTISFELKILSHTISGTWTSYV